jgi:hypothetical protein
MEQGFRWSGKGRSESAMRPVEELSPSGGTQVTGGIQRGQDGVWRWNYEMNMWKNPTILITVWKVMMLGGAFPVLLVTVLGLVEDGLSEALRTFGFMFLAVGAICTGLVLLAYPVVALAYGGTYQVVFEMDEKGVNHVQVNSQYDRAQVLAWLTTLAGFGAGSAQTAGAGLLAASKKNSYSEFKKVKKIVLKPSRNVIYLNQALERNQVYAEPDSFQQVADYIVKRCPKATVVTQ